MAKFECCSRTGSAESVRQLIDAPGFVEGFDQAFPAGGPE